MKKDFLKDILNEKSQVRPPAGMSKSFEQKFNNHLEFKKTKKRIFSGIKNFSMIATSLCIIAIAFINYSGPSGKKIPVNDYLSFIESSFQNEDFIHDNIDEVDGLAYTNIYEDY